MLDAHNSWRSSAEIYKKSKKIEWNNKSILLEDHPIISLKHKIEENKVLISTKLILFSFDKLGF